MTTTDMLDASPLHWLPAPGALDAELKALTAAGLPPEQSWPALVALANRRLDVLATAKLDRTVRRLVPEGAAPAAGRLRLAVLASHTVDHLVPAIRVAGLRRNLAVEVYVAPFGQIHQEVLDPTSGLHGFAPDVVMLMHEAGALFPPLSLDADASAARDAVVGQVEALRTLWRRLRDDLGAGVLQATVLGRAAPLFGSFELRVPAAPSSLVRRFNWTLAEAAAADGVLLLDLDAWSARFGTRTLTSTALWHHAKQEIAPAQAPLVGDLVGRVLAALRGLSRKALVLDLDNTLWGGVIGDDGLDGIVLGPGSPEGEAFAAFQHYVKRLAERGVVLAVSSKNDPEIARTAFARHPEMVLSPDDIAVFEASWADKPGALRRIAERLNLGLDALVFFDDNPVERALVRRELPMVAVPEVPPAPEDYVHCLADTGYFEAVAFTADDAGRARAYVANARRAEIQAQATDLDSFLRELAMELHAAPFDPANLPRIVQLINKTNQFNLTTRRYTEDQVRALMADPAVLTWYFRLSDRFGDNGIISIVIGRTAGNDAAVLELDTWLMSCRVIGRRVEQAVLAVVAEAARQRGLQALHGRYLPTAKNGLVREHYPRLGFEPVPAPAGAIAGETHWRLWLHSYQAPPLDGFTLKVSRT